MTLSKNHILRGDGSCRGACWWRNSLPLLPWAQFRLPGGPSERHFVQEEPLDARPASGHSWRVSSKKIYVTPEVLVVQRRTDGDNLSGACKVDTTGATDGETCELNTSCNDPGS